MTFRNVLRAALLASVCAAATAAAARDIDIPAGDLKAALDAYARQTGVALIVSDEAVRGTQTRGVKGALSPDEALARILKGTGFIVHRDYSGAIAIVPGQSSEVQPVQPFVLAQATPSPRTSVETVTVTSSKLGGADVQSIPIAITALSQEQLTATQTAGGPDLVKQVPNLTFTKTNFTGYSIQLRGIGTQAISVTTDPAVAVALNDVPFIRNHFFEQEFYDLGQVEVLRGPQGTLYGRNATAGVVNLTTARPSDQFEAMASAEIGNYHQKRFEAMINLPLVDDRVDLRVAGEWTKRQGYSFNEITNQRIDGRDLWSGRATLAFNPLPELKASLMWEHFSEDDDRMRTAKQLCKTDYPPDQIDGVNVPRGQTGLTGALIFGQNYLSQGCLPTSLYSPDAFQVPYGFALPYVLVASLGREYINPNVDPYASTVQSQNLRVIETQLNPIYKAKNDIVELTAEYVITPSLSFTSQTGFDQDFLWSTEDYNRFDTSPGLFRIPVFSGTDPRHILNSNLEFCDPQLGCSTRLVAQDLSMEHAWQLSQEFRLASSFSGPLNFSVGGNYMHYETEENYYVFINTLSLYTVSQGFAYLPYVPGVSDDHECLPKGQSAGSTGHAFPDPTTGGGQPTSACVYMDPNPITSLNNKGHNYFLSQNPYLLDSYAAFGEVYYNVLSDLKLIGGLRWTEDRKHFTNIPSEVVTEGYGYPSTGTVDQQWDAITGRAAINWTPKLEFTDQTLIYGSYAHGYKAGGANPPGAAFPSIEGTFFHNVGGVNGTSGEVGVPVHPLTFKPEYVDAFEVGSKNTLLDGAMTLNGDIFYYNYEHYQISQIVDRTSINLNFDAHVKGAELEAMWEPLPGLRFNFAGGYEDTAIAKGERAIDLIDRTAGVPGWMVVRPFPTQASNCILPTYVVVELLGRGGGDESATNPSFACSHAYNLHEDPVLQGGYTAHSPNYPGFDPNSVDPNAPAGVNDGLGLPPNNGEGFAKDLSGNELPNAPRFTVSAGAQYTVPLSNDWAGTFRGDFYWQDASWARVWNDDPYDRIHGYTNLNLALILTSQAGWQVMLYDKNVFNTTAITGTFLNSDDTGLTTNVFLTDPKLIGIRVTKNW
ncbi:MAG TPA: TonB-dependent receptor [Rhizomicrobium sp.]|nr:TonB-dependent receptor [Rhizomicrobium sp.]